MIIRQLGRCEYSATYEAMQKYTAARNADSLDEIWWLEHEPVFTLGRAGKDIHLGDTGDIPVLRVDRGGQVTYHGPGQLTLYLLLDIGRQGLGVRQLVTHIEQSIVQLLARWGVQANARSDAPGVYVDNAKIASLGLRISRGRSYHGLSFNIDMDMEPWQRINPCGLGVPVTQLSDWQDPCPSIQQTAELMSRELCHRLGYTAPSFQQESLPELMQVS